MEKPQPKKEVHIENYLTPSKYVPPTIYFWATQAAYEDLELWEFGHLKEDFNSHGRNVLVVDPRYDVEEIVEYMESYNKQHDDVKDLFVDEEE